MPSFQAKTKEELYPAEAPKQEVSEIPEADPEGLMYTGVDGYFIYRAPFTHTKADVLRDGYFDCIMAKNHESYGGALILYTVKAGDSNPENWTTGYLRVTQVRATKGVSSEAPTKVCAVKL